MLLRILYHTSAEKSRERCLYHAARRMESAEGIIVTDIEGHDLQLHNTFPFENSLVVIHSPQPKGVPNSRKASQGLSFS